MSSAYSHVGLVALPFEVSTSFIHGTVDAPEVILQELEKIDGFDFNLGRNPFENIPRMTIRPYERGLEDPFLEQAHSSRAVNDLLEAGAFPICIGGEHTVSLGPIRVARLRGELGVVQLDAHADLRNQYDDNYFSHACVMRRVLGMGCELAAIGIRTMCEEENALVNVLGLKQVDGRTVASRTDWYGIIDDLPNRIYLTVDMDAFNPEVVSAVGTPEPGGPGYEEVVSFLTYLFDKKDVVAADIVELRPGKLDAASLRLAVRLIGAIVGLRFKA